MRYLNIHLLHAKDGSLIYPVDYQNSIGNLAKDHLYYKDDTDEDYLILAIQDADWADSMIQDNVEEMAEVDMIATSEANETRSEVITNQAVVSRLQIKAQLGQTFTADELAALDPTNPTEGFGITQILADRVPVLNTAESTKVAAIAAKQQLK